MDKDEIKHIINEALTAFKKEIDESILKVTLERNTKLIEAVKSDHADINLEILIRDYLNIGDLGDISVNYSFIQNKRLKKQLTIDNLQMEKYRLGLVNGSPDFIGFCKYAHLQIEGLISYFIYTKVGGDFEEFKKQFPTVKLYSSTSFSKLSHSQKTNATNTALKIDGSKNFGSIRQNVLNVRNSYSHRSFQSAKDEYVENFNGGKYPSDLPNNEEEKKKILKEYYTLKFIANEDFTKIRDSIKDLATLIKTDLKK